MKIRLREALRRVRRPGIRALGPRPLGAAAAAAAIALLSACAGRIPPGVPADPVRASAALRAWETFRASVVSRGPEEIFYDVSARRSIVSGSFVAAVRCEPGRSLSVVLEGPLGAPLGRARWDGTRTVVERGGAVSEGETSLAELGIPLPARELSTLFFGLPESEAPDRVTVADGALWLAWKNDIACVFDPSGPRVDRVVARSGGRRVEIVYSEWKDGTPTRIRIDVAHGGRADLVLRSAVEAGG